MVFPVRVLTKIFGGTKTDNDRGVKGRKRCCERVTSTNSRGIYTHTAQERDRVNGTNHTLDAREAGGVFARSTEPYPSK